MTGLIPTLRAIIREELTRCRMPELGVVTSVFAKEDDSGDGNHQVNVTLRGSGVELQRVPVAVDRAGWSSLPRAGDLVVVAFLEGDLNAPVVLGTIYDNTLRPPKASPLDLVCTTRPMTRTPRCGVSISNCPAAARSRMAMTRSPSPAEARRS
jgi:hypothetical protein